MPFTSYAQNGEDVLLWRALGDVAEGFYVDVGAAHPDEDSVTRAFYDRGWRGINIEPVPAMAKHIADARPRDTTLAVAAGAVDGTVTLHVLEGTGLSTTDEEVLASLGEFAAAHSKELRVPRRKLASILDEHAPERIEFLKIDVEGAERGVLEGCDFRRHRPRVVLVEATWPNTTRPTHEAWEHLLVAARYRFAFFDGVNRFYVADEWADALAPRLAVPANSLDGFVRISDSASARQAAEQESRFGGVLARAKAAEDSARAAYARAFEQARDVGALRHHLTSSEHERKRLQPVAARAEALERELAATNSWLAATHRSTSWRVTKPLRALSALARSRRPETPAPTPAPPIFVPAPKAAPDALIEGLPIASVGRMPHQTGPLRSVHQFHSGSATGDAITNSMLLIRRQLRRLGYRSDIFVEHRDPALAEDLRSVAELPRQADHLLIVHHSMGYDAIERILAHPAPKVLYYHNITPPRLLPPGSALPAYAALGREQLGLLKSGVAAAVAASAYNAIDLRLSGFDPVWVSTLLFDVGALRSRAAAPAPRPPDHPYTVLFVGRVIESKGQADLVDAFAQFRGQLDRPARLVLAGRTDSPGTYLEAIDDRMREHGLEAELVLTGLISDAELKAQYEAADLYVSLSHHEGFGVPLVEAMAHGIPVLAWPAGAIPYTLGSEAGLLPRRDPHEVAAAMLGVARDPDRRAELLASQAAALERFALDRQWPMLQEALVFAGAAPPADPGDGWELAAHLRFAIFGHTHGSYSLAAVNRGMAAAIETERPGHVRLIPVEGSDICLPRHARRLTEREAPETGPEVVISQHYPVRVPDVRGDVNLALVFWEESLLPEETIAALNEGFQGVLAPSTFVAKALVDSGLTRPVHVIGQAPALALFETIAWERGRRSRPEQPFTFLHVSSCFPRKGVDVLLAAYARAFRRGDDVRLVIKGFANPHNSVPQQVAACRDNDPGLAPIEVIDRDLDDERMLDLFRRADAMVLPTRGEGFNLPAAEAMAAGVPLIVTGAGGHMDFCGADTARLVRYRLAPSDSHLASGHSLWAEPDLDDLVAALREVEAARREPEARTALHARTQRARDTVRQRLGSRRMVRLLQQAALETILRPPPSPVVVGWITSWGVRCGIAEYSRHLIDAMPAHPGIAAHLVLPDDRSEPVDGRVRPAWTLVDATTLHRLESAISAEDPRVLVVQHQPGLMPWDMLATLLASPVIVGRVVVVTLHNTRSLLDVALPERDRVCSALARLSRVVVHSLSDLHRLQDLGVSANVTLMPHGVRESLPRRSARDVGAAPLIGCYGFFLPGKGIAELIEAFALLRRNRPGARLRLVNADYGTAASEEEIARCRALAGELGLAEAIAWETRFLPDEESLALLAPCDVIVMPTQSSMESSSAAVRTALAAGPPVLVTPLALYDDVRSAVLHADGIAPSDLAASLDALLSDPDGCRKIQGFAEAWLRSHAWFTIAELLQGMLLGLITVQQNVKSSRGDFTSVA